MDQNQERRRGHFHRGRRGGDRRGFDRRTAPNPQQEQPPAREQVDVEQIMREIRARISQRQGGDLSNQQIEELAARRLESILDPRSVNPALLDQMRTAAAAPRGQQQVSPEPAYTFDDNTIYETHRGLLRALRRLFRPLLKLFFNPAPIAHALGTQARLNVEAAQREIERDRRQAEWNALHYEILRRLVLEVSRASIDLQALSGRIESLAAKVDFNERRVRGIEGTLHTARPAAPARAAEPQTAAPAPSPEPAQNAEQPSEGTPSQESSRRRRRRRRGRRSGMGSQDGATQARPSDSTGTVEPAVMDSGTSDEDVEPEPEDESPAIEARDAAFPPPVTTEGETLVEPPDRYRPAVVPAADVAPGSDVAPGADAAPVAEQPRPSTEPNPHE